MFDFKIAIVSYNRANEQLTLDYLERIQFPKDKIFLFVQCEKDYKEYLEKYSNKVNKILYYPASNVAENRNNVLKHFSKGNKLVFLDDDIKYLCKLSNGGLKPLETCSEVLNLFELGFNEAKKRKTIAWCLYPVANPFFMKNKISDKAMIIGTVFGLINCGINFDNFLCVKEDYDISCKIIINFEKLPRLDYYTAVAKHQSKGGCEESRKDTEMFVKCTKILLNRYPNILRINPTRENEILMKR